MAFPPNRSTPGAKRSGPSPITRKNTERSDYSAAVRNRAAAALETLDIETAKGPWFTINGVGPFTVREIALELASLPRSLGFDLAGVLGRLLIKPVGQTTYVQFRVGDERTSEVRQVRAPKRHDPALIGDVRVAFFYPPARVAVKNKIVVNAQWSMPFQMPDKVAVKGPVRFAGEDYAGAWYYTKVLTSDQTWGDVYAQFMASQAAHFALYGPTNHVYLEKIHKRSANDEYTVVHFVTGS